MTQKTSEIKVKRRKRRSQIGIVAEVAAAYGVKLPPEQLEPSLSPNQIGGIMGVTGEAVKQWIYHRRLPAVRLANGYWQVRKSDFERFLKARFEGVKRRILAVGLDGESLRVFNQAIDPNRQEALSTDLLADAMLKINDLQPAAVVVDIAWKQGWELVERIRASKGLSGIPVLVLEPTAGAMDLERATELGIKGCLTKPINAPALAQQIAGITDRYI